MPIYEYRCEKCDCQFEQLVSSGEKKPVICPKCGSKQVKKCISCFSSSGILHEGGCNSSGSKGFS
jgi:putative FmdB family regulatory protein